MAVEEDRELLVGVRKSRAGGGLTLAVDLPAGTLLVLGHKKVADDKGCVGSY